MKRLIKEMIISYDEENLQDLDRHIENEAKKPRRPVYKMVVKHTGPTKVELTEESAKNLAKIILS